MFSDREHKIIKIIGRKRMTIQDICTELYTKRNIPFEPRISTANSIRRIISKCSFFNLDWTLYKTRTNNKLFVKREKRL